MWVPSCGVQLGLGVLLVFPRVKWTVGPPLAQVLFRQILARVSALFDQVREVDLKTEDKRGLRPLRDSATPIQDIGRGSGAGERPAGTSRTDLPWNNCVPR